MIKVPPHWKVRKWRKFPPFNSKVERQLIQNGQKLKYQGPVILDDELQQVQASNPTPDFKGKLGAFFTFVAYDALDLTRNMFNTKRTSKNYKTTFDKFSADIVKIDKTAKGRIRIWYNIEVFWEMAEKSPHLS